MNLTPNEPDVLSSLCERLYFHEIQARENLNSRLQLPFAIIVAITGYLGFLLQNLERGLSNFSFWAFAFCAFFAFSFLFISACHFMKAVSGHTYEFIAPGNYWIAYKDECQKTYDEYVEVDELAKAAFSKTLMEEYGAKTSVNSNINDDRSLQLHLTMQMMVHAVLYTAIASLFFYFGDLDKSHHSKPYAVKIVSEVKTEK